MSSTVKRTGLLVDDDALFRDFGFTPFARRCNIEIDCAGSVADAMSCFAERDYDLLFVDLRLDGEDGCRVIRHASRLDEPPYTIVVSGTCDVREASAAWRSGARDLLAKPFDFREFSAAVDRAPNLSRRLAPNPDEQTMPPWIRRFAREYAPDQARTMLAARYSGQTNAEIGSQLGVATDTVKHRLRVQFFRRLGAGRLAELERAARAWYWRQRE